MTATPPSYCPQRPRPSYAFLPGRDPHPTRDPRGHSYGREEAARFQPREDWRECEDYLFGVDLFNEGYFWEAHEAWEGLWMAAEGRDEVQRLLLQGLIQLTAARLKIAMQQPAGLAKLTRTGTEKLERVRELAGERVMGLELAPFIAASRAFAETAPSDGRAGPALVLTGL